MKNIQFLVDAAILRELGERLIGRPAIALGELVKNSFDADASTSQIEFRQDEIVVSDDGSGMSKDDFLHYWMRLFTTHKVDQGTSPLGRPLTGSKGIGRLSTHFLADEMILESTAIAGKKQHLYAKVDWSTAISGENLNTVNVQWEMRPGILTDQKDIAWSTRITLKRLKADWDIAAIRELGKDVWMLRSPFRRTGPSKTKPGRETGKTRRPEDFDIEIVAPEIVNAREVFDETLQKVFSNWKARIRGSLDSGRKKGTAVISVDFRADYPEGSEEAKRFQTSVRLPINPKEDEPKEALIDKAKFEILIFKTVGRQPGGISVSDLREYLEQFGNVSLYDAGFRLPYYGSRAAAGQDWLSVAVDQSRRLNVSELLPERFRTQNKYMQDLPALGRLFGAVEVNTNHERKVAGKGSPPDGWLQIQPGRDRLKDNTPFKQLRDLVRSSLDFYANRHRLLDLETAEQARAKEPPSKKYDRAIKILESNKSDIPKPVFLEIRREVTDALKASKAEERVRDSRAVLLAPLATAGMTALALNHEISRESSFLERISSRLRRIAAKHAIDELKQIANEFDDARRRLDSLRELFAPLLSDEDKAATDRLKVGAVVDQSIRGMRALMQGVQFDTSGIPLNLRFPLGALADWNAVLQNVLSNSWNALLDTDEARIAFTGGRDKGGREWLHVSDSGQGLDVSLTEAEKLFEPFERRMKISNDKRSIAIGGQGLGLAIVRMIAHRRSARVAFVRAEEGFSTTFEIAWRGSKT
jgi:signal transduction histidine kinase